MYARFLGQLFVSFPWKRLQWVKKIVVPCLDVIMNAFFPRNIQWSSHFARKARVNTERVPPGHPIILLKSNEYNMAAVSVERSIENFDYREIAYPRGYSSLKVTGVFVGTFREHPHEGTRILLHGRVGQHIGSIFSCAGKAVDQKSKQTSSP